MRMGLGCGGNKPLFWGQCFAATPFLLWIMLEEQWTGPETADSHK